MGLGLSTLTAVTNRTYHLVNPDAGFLPSLFFSVYTYMTGYLPAYMLFAVSNGILLAGVPVELALLFKALVTTMLVVVCIAMMTVKESRMYSDNFLYWCNLVLFYMLLFSIYILCSDIPFIGIVTGIVIFTAYIIIDTQFVILDFEERNIDEPVYHAVGLYVDVWNLFLRILYILMKDSDSKQSRNR